MNFLKTLVCGFIKKHIINKNMLLKDDNMDEKILNPDYIEQLSDETFLRTIIVRTATFEDKRNLLKIYEIPIPEVNPEYWSPVEVMRIVDRLKEISKDIDWDETVLGGHTSEAISFMALLEVIAGKRNLNKLAYLVFNEMYI